MVILRDDKAPATARASAGRTLLEMGVDDTSNDAPENEMSVEEIDAEIARTKKRT